MSTGKIDSGVDELFQRREWAQELDAIAVQEKPVTAVTRENRTADADEHTFSECQDVLDHIAANFDMTAKARLFFDAVIGTAHDNASSSELLLSEQFIEARDLDVGKRISRDSRSDKSAQALKKTTQRYRTSFFDWQKNITTTLIQVETGGTDKKKHFPKSRYRLPVLAMATIILNNARQDPDYTQPGRARFVLERETKRVMSSFGKSAREHRRRDGVGTRRTDAAAEIKRDSATLITKTNKVVQIKIKELRRQGINGHELTKRVQLFVINLADQFRKTCDAALIDAGVVTIEIEDEVDYLN